MRNALVTALTSCADRPVKRQARRFLDGLSFDELQFIAEFHGACLLEHGCEFRCSREQLAERIAGFQQPGACGGVRSEDRDHKIILLFEYLRRQNRPTALARAAGA